MPNDIALRALATRAVDPYNKRHIREAGEDLFRMLRRYREREAWGASRVELANWEDSLAELSALVEDMLVVRQVA